MVAGRYNWFRRPWGARGFNFSVVSAAGCQKVRTLQRNGEQTVNPPARGWPRRRRVHMFRRRASEKFACFVLMRWRVHIFRPRAPKGSHFRLRAPKGSRLSSSGAGGFVFLILGRRRVRIFRPWAPKGSHFWFLCAEGFTLLVLVCRRVRIFRTRVAQAPEGSIFLPGDQENLMFEKCVFLTWFEIKNVIFGCWPL